MNYSIPNTPMNQALAATVTSRIGADRRMVSAKAACWRLLGMGGLVLLAGLGLGAAFLGYSYYPDQQEGMNKLSAAIADALNKVTLKADGTVKLADGTVKLADGTVKLNSTGSTVRLDTTNSTVRLDTSGSSVGMRPTPQQLQPDSRPPSNARTVTNYTIFKEVEFGQGTVMTGWAFRSNEDVAPSSQFCYYFQGSSDDYNSAMKYDIARNGVMVTPARKLPVNIQQAFSNCVWWQS